MVENSRIKANRIQTEHGVIVHLELDHAETKNSMTLEMGLAFDHTLQSLASESPLPRVCVISGKNGVFSSGGDFQLLQSFSEKSAKDNIEFMSSFYRLFLSVREMPFPVIAAVNGHAIGAALAVALACDLRYFVPDAKYALNFVKIGIHPGMGSSFLLKEIAGMVVAQDLILTGRYFTGKEALDMRICHGLFSKDEMVNGAMEVAKQIAANAPRAVRLAKKSLYATRSIEEAVALESQYQAETYGTNDFKEALRAIAQKGTPSYKDE